MKTIATVPLDVADQVWVATALLHREHPERADFSKQEIQERATLEDAQGASRPGVSIHISTHCVATSKPSPAKHRMLTRTRTGRMRLFRTGDSFHPQRSKGHTAPPRENLPEIYHQLLDWYKQEYDKPAKAESGEGKSEGATAEALMKMMGRISREDADELIRIIDESCGRVDANEW